MEDNQNPNNNRNYGGGGGMNRPRGGNRFRHGGGGGGGGRHGQPHQGRGRSQRPLLTSSINGAGLSLVALMATTNPQAHNLLAIAVISFGVSSLVSYFAQRLRPPIFEKISDLFFIVGAALIIMVAMVLGKFI